MKLNCFIADCNLPDGPPAIAQLELAGQPISYYFETASATANLGFAFDLSRRNVLSSSVPTDGTVSQDELLNGLVQVLSADADSSPPSVALLFAGRYEPAPGQYGLMFDVDHPDGSPGHRQGCALFLEAIWTKFFLQAEATRDTAFREAVGYIAVHELGHIFNLWHEGGDDNSFMKAHPAPDQLGDLSFNAQQQSYLALAAEGNNVSYVLPGRGSKPFGTLAPGYTSSDNSAFAAPDTGDLELRIGLSHDSLWSFEPVELDLELHLAETATAPAIIPDEIDPSYPTLKIWIIQPDGERLRYRPQFRSCGNNGFRTLAPGEFFRRDVAIARQSNGFTFGAAGQYKVEAEFYISAERVLRSNAVTCEVRLAAPASAAWREARSILDRHDIQRLLRFKSSIPSYVDCARLADFAERKASPATSAAIDYALGKALLRASRQLPRNDYREDVRRRGISQLQRALKGERLSRHRSHSSERLLASVSKESLD